MSMTRDELKFTQYYAPLKWQVSSSGRMKLKEKPTVMDQVTITKQWKSDKDENIVKITDGKQYLANKDLKCSWKKRCKPDEEQLSRNLSNKGNKVLCCPTPGLVNHGSWF